MCSEGSKGTETLLEGSLCPSVLVPSSYSDPQESTLGGKGQGLSGLLRTLKPRDLPGCTASQQWNWSPRPHTDPTAAFSVRERLLSSSCVPAPSLAGRSRQGHRELRLRQSTHLAGLQEGCLEEVGRSSMQTCEAVQTRRCERQAGYAEHVYLAWACVP